MDAAKEVITPLYQVQAPTPKFHDAASTMATREWTVDSTSLE